MLFQIILLSIISFLKAEGRSEHDTIDLYSAGTGVLPYMNPNFRYGIPHGNMAGPLQFGLQNFNGLQQAGNSYEGYAGLGIPGIYNSNSFGKHGYATGAGGELHGLQNGFGGLYGNKGGFGNQFIGGNSNTFAKEKVFSQNKNFGSGLKGGFGVGYGIQGSHHNQGTFGGYGGLGSTGQAGFEGHGFTGAGVGVGG